MHRLHELRTIRRLILFCRFRRIPLKLRENQEPDEAGRGVELEVGPTLAVVVDYSNPDETMQSIDYLEPHSQ
jgi:hypothetical protein